MFINLHQFETKMASEIDPQVTPFNIFHHVLLLKKSWNINIFATFVLTGLPLIGHIKWGPGVSDPKSSGTDLSHSELQSETEGPQNGPEISRWLASEKNCTRCPGVQFGNLNQIYFMKILYIFKKYLEIIKR